MIYLIEINIYVILYGLIVWVFLDFIYGLNFRLKVMVCKNLYVYNLEDY